ncbi:PH domain-containing protein [Actinokineospora iranica]|uniref:PH domain-containing protein n=1 Tax=Actinokineospora iranica TaxID=1271860 RepID=A0A1G6MUN5_9PSEU|nr:PH domain-containing protein [Actinokineospora iranica]SDC59273.1 PH domain-containing protein [Actinokineospora iranica]
MDEVVTVIRRRVELVAGWLATAGLTLFAGWLALFPAEEVTFFSLAQGLFAMWLGIWVVWLASAHPKLVVSTRGLDIVNWVCRYRIPWAAIHRIETTDHISFRLLDGTTVLPAVAAWSIVAIKHGNPVQQAMANRIEQIRANGDPDDTEVTRTLEICWLPFVVLLVLLLILAWLSTH